MMELFHKFQSRQFQFDLELIARLSSEAELPNHILYEMAQCYGLDHADKCIQPLADMGIVEKNCKGVRLAEDFTAPILPLSDLEEDYLQYILDLPEAKLFMDESLMNKLKNPSVEPIAAEHQQFRPRNPQPVPEMSPSEFQRILQAIRSRRWIQYVFSTKADPALVPGEAIPWKLEYSAYDCRWWLILYLPEQKRTVKAWLNNLRQIHLGDFANVKESEIEEAMQKLLVAEPVTIRIKPEKNALDRCARVFERQMLQQIYRNQDGTYEMSFRYYRFDENEILRKLLYLGPSVQLTAPKHLCGSLKRLLDEAIGNTSYQF